jgi:hypothetical protein
MRVQASATSISWIPSESVGGTLRVGFELGLTHFDEPPPDFVSGVQHVWNLCRADKFRFSNVVSGWADVEDGRIVGSGFAEESGLVMGSTTLRVGKVGATFRAISLPAIQQEPQQGDGRVTFLQTVGGATGAPRWPCTSTPTAPARSSWSAPARSRGTGCTAPTASWPSRAG